MNGNDTSAQAKPPAVDAQDPLPEATWFFRRIFVFGLSVALLAMIWFKIDAVADVARAGSETAIAGLVALLKWCLATIGALILFYLLAPSAEQLTRLIQTARTLQTGRVAFRSSSSATSADGAHAQSRTEAGPVTLHPERETAGDGASGATELPGNDETPLPWRRENGP